MQDKPRLGKTVEAKLQTKIKMQECRPIHAQFPTRWTLSKHPMKILGYDPGRYNPMVATCHLTKILVESTLMSRNSCNGESGSKSPVSGDLNRMPKVAPWRLAIMAIVAKLAILAEIARGLAISRMWQNIPIGCQKWPLQSR